MIDALIIVASVALVPLAILALWWLARTSPGKDTGDPFCAWCTWRDGDTCTHPKSPVSGRGCGPVCIGDLQCNLRELRYNS